MSVDPTPSQSVIGCCTIASMSHFIFSGLAGRCSHYMMRAPSLNLVNNEPAATCACPVWETNMFILQLVSCIEHEMAYFICLADG